jgi:protein TonB
VNGRLSGGPFFCAEVELQRAAAVSNSAGMEGIMFRETLLESSPARRKSKRWPMATAFTVELVIAGFLIVLPLLSSGILPVSAQPPLYAPISSVQVVETQHRDSSHAASGTQFTNQQSSVVSFGHQQPHLCFTNCATSASGNDEVSANWDIGIGSSGPNGPGFAWAPEVKPRLERVKVSNLSEAQLIKKVEPIYPKIAIATGIHGEVKLHAIIAKDGSIQSISVISGHPLLATAALEAVRQWRYHPYVLNKEPVEVETFITVNFTGVRN